MKRVIIATVFLLIGGQCFSQDRTKDKAAINKQVDAMIYSWNHHNYDDLKNYTTENTDWVNGIGAWWKGREESQYGHQIYHNTIFKESILTKTSVNIRFVTDDVALAHLYWHFSAFTDPRGEVLGPDDCIASIVY